MKGFFSFLARVKDTGSWLSKSVLALPVIALLADIVPPWPIKAAVTGLTTIAELLLLMYAYEAWSTRSKPALLKRMRRFGTAAVLLLTVYLTGLAFFTFEDPAHGRMAMGFTYTEHAEAIIQRLGGNLTRALPAAEWDATRIWTAGSIRAVQLGLLFAWLASFAALTVFVGAFVARKRR